MFLCAKKSSGGVVFHGRIGNGLFQVRISSDEIEVLFLRTCVPQVSKLMLLTLFIFLLVIF